MRVITVPCLRDNYAYLVVADGRSQCAVVDPSEAEPVLRALVEHGLELCAILNTHHHHDHVGGNAELKAHVAGRRADLAAFDVFGHVSDEGRIPEQTRFLQDGERFEVAGLGFRALHIPGHTLGAVAYVIDDVVFTGDTLFAAGCGRLFEGTPADMHRSLNVTLGALPDATHVYCGHEYTANNLRFAASVEPNNAAVHEKAERVAAQRARGEPTVPSTLAEERATNPFMRCDSAEIRRSLHKSDAADPVEVLGALRAAKDRF